MGYDPTHFTTEQVNEAIEYLLPSSLYSKRSRPIFKEPHLVFPPQKKLQCDKNGRPLNSYFYTTHQNFYKIMNEAVYKLEDMNLQVDQSYFNKIIIPSQVNKIRCAASSDYISKADLMNMTNEIISDAQYEQWLVLMKRLTEHPLSYLAEEFLRRFRTQQCDAVSDIELPEPFLDPVTNRKYVQAFGQKKNSFAEATLYMPGTGEFKVNEKRLLEMFPELGNREQIVFPLQQTNTIGKVDIVATVNGKGPSCLANALRLAIARCLASMLPVDQGRNRLLVTGLLAQDNRLAERKQPGQKKARKKPIWKAR
ncbi:28S ribosomal protein S9 [Schistosoma japonicum]|nr:28S ribosomal protein S9 [Schistosoma japonicum]